MVLKGLAVVKFWYTLQVLMEGQKQCKTYGSIENNKLALVKKQTDFYSAACGIGRHLLIVDIILRALLLALLLWVF